jgi:hypothetical protein
LLREILCQYEPVFASNAYDARALRAALLAVDRICRTSAFTAYADKGRTRASFERGWDALFADLAAEFERAHVHASE